MFDIGEKVILLTSTVKKGAGPRRGSCGYVTSTGNVAFLKSLEIYVCPIQIVFTRYGFETSNKRSEKKTITAVVPGVDSNITVQQFVDKYGQEGSNGELFKHLRAETGSSNTMAVVIPYNDKLSMETDLYEFRSWVDSILSNDSIKYRLREIFSGEINVGQGLDTTILRKALDMAHDREEKLKGMKKYEEGNRTRFIEALRILLITNKVKHLHLHREHFRNSLASGKYGAISFSSKAKNGKSVDIDMMNSLFIDDLSDMRTSELNEANAFNPEIIKAFLGVFESIKKGLLEMGHAAAG